MIFFLDTEFSRLPTPHDWPDPCAHIKLLSAGIVPLDPGAPVFYIEINDPVETHELGNFTIKEVIPIMMTHDYVDVAARISREPWGNDHDPRMSRHRAAKHVSEYIRALGGGVLVCDFLMDWLLIAALIKNDWPSGLNQDGYRIANARSTLDVMEVTRDIVVFFHNTRLPRHHALADAAALRFAWKDKIDKLIEPG